MPTVSISDPDAGATVKRSLTATGSASAAPTVTLVDSNGGLIATAIVAFANGNWSAMFLVMADQTGCKIVADVAGTQSIKTNITVKD